MIWSAQPNLYAALLVHLHTSGDDFVVGKPCCASKFMEILLHMYLTLGVHSQEGYSTCVSASVSVCYHSSTSLISMLNMRYVGVYLRL